LLRREPSHRYENYLAVSFIGSIKVVAEICVWCGGRLESNLKFRGGEGVFGGGRVQGGECGGCQDQLTAPPKSLSASLQTTALS